VRRYLLWHGLVSQLNLIRKVVASQDVGACNPAVKAAIDGIVDAGVLPDDSSKFVRSLIYLPPQNDKNSLVLYIRGAKREER
jgi:hypothetical protein